MRDLKSFVLYFPLSRVLKFQSQQVIKMSIADDDVTLPYITNIVVICQDENSIEIKIEFAKPFYMH